MIYNRPPLNCQKCQFRFFTDQGLERHLLGSHGLVTASMQDAANKGQDSGRCPVCGKVDITTLLKLTLFSSLTIFRSTSGSCWTTSPRTTARPWSQPTSHTNAPSAQPRLVNINCLRTMSTLHTLGSPRRRTRINRWEHRYSRSRLSGFIIIFKAAKTGGSVLKSAVKLSDEISIIPTKKENKDAVSLIWLKVKWGVLTLTIPG